MKWLPKIEDAAEMLAIARGDFEAIEKLIDNANPIVNKKLRSTNKSEEIFKAQGVAEFIEEIQAYFSNAHNWATSLYEKEVAKKKM